MDNSTRDVSFTELVVYLTLTVAAWTVIILTEGIYAAVALVFVMIMQTWYHFFIRENPDWHYWLIMGVCVSLIYVQMS